MAELQVGGLDLQYNDKGASKVQGYANYLDITKLAPAERDALRNAFAENDYGFQKSDVYVGYAAFDGYLYFKSPEALEAALADEKVGSALRNAMVKSGVATEVTVATEDKEAEYKALIEQSIKDGGDVQNKDGIRIRELQEELGTEKAAEILASMQRQADAADKGEAAQSVWAQKGLQKYEDTLSEEEKAEKKSKYAIIADMMQEGNFLGAIMAMIFMPNDAENVGEALEQTKENAAQEGKGASAQPELSDKAKNDIEMIKARDAAEKEVDAAKNRLSEAETKLAEAKEKFKDGTKTAAEIKELEDAKRGVDVARADYESRKDDPSLYLTSGEREMAEKLKAMEARLKEVEKERDQYAEQTYDQKAELGKIEKERDQYAEQTYDNEQRADTAEKRADANRDLANQMQAERDAQNENLGEVQSKLDASKAKSQEVPKDTVKPVTVEPKVMPQPAPPSVVEQPAPTQQELYLQQRIAEERALQDSKHHTLYPKSAVVGNAGGSPIYQGGEERKVFYEKVGGEEGTGSPDQRRGVTQADVNAAGEDLAALDIGRVNLRNNTLVGKGNGAVRFSEMEAAGFGNVRDALDVNRDGVVGEGEARAVHAASGLSQSFNDFRKGLDRANIALDSSDMAAFGQSVNGFAQVGGIRTHDNNAQSAPVAPASKGNAPQTPTR